MIPANKFRETFLFDVPLTREADVLNALFEGIASGVVDDATWERFEAAARRDGKEAEIAFAFETTLQGRRAKTYPAPVQAEFFYRAADFALAVLDDDVGGRGYLERCLAIAPSHPKGRDRLFDLLLAAGDPLEQAEWELRLCVGQARPVVEAAVARAAELTENAPGGEALAIRACEEWLKLDANAPEPRAKLLRLYAATNRPRELARMLESQVALEGEDEVERLLLHAQLLALYTGDLQEPDKALPHAEAVLLADPENAHAIASAEQLTLHRPAAARATTALAEAAFARGESAAAAQWLQASLEHLRSGPKRREHLIRLGDIRAAVLSDLRGALESYEAAFLLDPTDDAVRDKYTQLAVKLGGALDAVRTLVRIAPTVKEAGARARISLATGVLLYETGDKKRAKVMLQTGLAGEATEPEQGLLGGTALLALAREDRDQKTVLFALERLCVFERDSSNREALLVELAQMATAQGDRERACFAWKKLIDTARRDEALAALTELLEQRGEWEDLALILDLRATGAADLHDARNFAFRAASLLGRADLHDKAQVAWEAFRDRFGASREFYAEYIPTLERSANIQALGAALEADAELADPADRPALMLRAGQFHCEKTADLAAAERCLRAAVGVPRAASIAPRNPSIAPRNPSIPPVDNDWNDVEANIDDWGSDEARATEVPPRNSLPAGASLAPSTLMPPSAAAQTRTYLERLLRTDATALMAARLLDPHARASNRRETLVALLDVRARLEVDRTPKLAALEERLTLARDESVATQAAILGKILRDALEHQGEPLRVVDRLTALCEAEAPALAAQELGAALDALAVDSLVRCRIAIIAGELFEQVGAAPRAIALYEKALEFDPRNPKILDRMERLLAATGSRDSKLAFYTKSLEQATDRLQRRALLVALANVLLQEIPKDCARAASLFGDALALAPADHEAFAGKAAALTELGDSHALYETLGARLLVAPQADHPGLLLQQATLAGKHGEAGLQQKHVQTALESPELSSAQALELRALALGHPNLAATALGACARLATTTEEAASLYAELGELLATAGDAPAAARAFRQAASAHLAHAAAARAAKCLQRACKLDNNLETSLALADACLAANDRTGEVEALLAAQPFATASGFAVELWVRTAEAAIAAGAPTQALSYFAKAACIAPDEDALIHRFRALALEHRQQALFVDTIAHILGETAQQNEAATPSPTAAVKQLTYAQRTELACVRAEVLAQSNFAEAARALRAVYMQIGGTEIAAPRAEDRALRGRILDCSERICEPLADEPLSISKLAERRAELRWVRQTRIESSAQAEQVALYVSWAQTEEVDSSAGPGDGAFARTLYEAARAIDPQHPEVLPSLARLAAAAGDIDGATSALDALRVGADPNRAERLDIDAAQLLCNAGRIREALQRIERVLNQSPQNVGALRLCETIARGNELKREAVDLLGSTLDRIERGGDRDSFLSQLATLLDATRETADLPVRRSWFVRLATATSEANKRLTLALEGAAIFPDEDALWDIAEEATRIGRTPEPLAAAFDGLLAHAKHNPDLIRFGSRIVDFRSEWYGDDASIIPVLETLFELDQADTFAFDRLKLIYDGRGLWEELFGLYDRACARAEKSQRAVLLEEAAQTAKDFARDNARAISYFEQLAQLRPNSARIETTLERLYEREGRTRDIVALGEQQLARGPNEASPMLRERLAELELVAHRDPGHACLLLAPELRGGRLPRPSLVALVARALALGVELLGAQPATDLRSHIRTLATALAEHHDAEGDAPAAAKAREALLLSDGQTESALQLREQLASGYERAGDARSALPHLEVLFAATPNVDAVFQRLEKAAVRAELPHAAAHALLGAADTTTDGQLRGELLLRAAAYQVERLLDPRAGAATYMHIAQDVVCTNEARGQAAERAIPLLEAQGLELDVLTVWEVLAQLESRPKKQLAAFATAGRLAERLGETARAISAWEARRGVRPMDREATDQLIELYSATAERGKLAALLGDRSTDNNQSRDDQRLDLRRRARLIDHAECTELELPRVAWQEFEARFGEDYEASLALATLAERAGEVDVFGQELARARALAANDSERVELALRLAYVHGKLRKDGTRAIAALADALALDATNAEARGQLRRLCDDANHRQAALAALRLALDAAGDHAAQLELTDVALALEVDAEGRAEVLGRARELAELRMTDISAAFVFAQRAFAEVFGAEAEAEMLRIAQRADRFADAAESLRLAVAASSGAARARFSRSLAHTLEGPLSDPRAALAAYAEATELDRTDLVSARGAIRCAALVGAWDKATQVILATVMVDGAADAELAKELDAAAKSRDDWDKIAAAMASEIRGGRYPRTFLVAVETRLGRIHRDRRQDDAEAERAFQHALAIVPGDRELLAELCGVQRSRPGPALIETLLALHEVDPEDRGTLREAVVIATEQQTTALARTAAAKLREVSRVPLRTAQDALAEADYRLAVRTLDGLLEAQQEYEACAELFSEACTLHISEELLCEHAVRASQLLQLKLGKPAQALSALSKAPRLDTRVAEQLHALYIESGDLESTAALLLEQIEASPAGQARADLRSWLARNYVARGLPTEAIAMLRTALDEFAPDASIADALVLLLRAAGRFSELAILHRERGEYYDNTNAPNQAATAYYQAGNIQLVELHARDSAEQLFALSYAREPNLPAAVALANAAEHVADWDAASVHLRAACRLATHAEQTSLVVRHLTALEQAGRRADAARVGELAIRSWNQGAAEPDEQAARTVIVARTTALLRQLELHETLARILDESRKLPLAADLAWTYLLEACSLRISYLGEPAVAEAALRAAGAEPHQAQPVAADAPLASAQERAGTLLLADALVAQNRFAEAREVLAAVVAAFGGRRPKERAYVHYHLGRLAASEGDGAAALNEYEAAIRIDPAHRGALLASAEYLREKREFARAERAYRALLTVQKRSAEDPSGKMLSQSEVLLQLAAIADAQEDHERSQEILESAFEIAAESATESERFERALRRDGRHEELTRQLARRPHDTAAKIERATLLGRMLNRRTEAFDSLIGSTGNVTELDTIARLLVEFQAGPTQAPAVLAALNAAAIAQTTLGGGRIDAEFSIMQARQLVASQDRAGAAEVLEAARSTAPNDLNVLRELRALYTEQANSAKLGDVLADTIGATEDPAQKRTWLLELVALQLREAATIDKAVANADRLLAMASERADVLEVVQTATEQFPHATALIVLFERVAREAASPTALVEALTLRWEADPSDLSSIREALALCSDDLPKAESLLRRAAAGSTEAHAKAWALIELARRRAAQGDPRSALAFYQEAIGLSAAADAGELRREALTCALAADELNVALELGEQLRASEPGDPSHARTLCELLRKAKRWVPLAELLGELGASAETPEERGALLSERVQILEIELHVSPTELGHALAELVTLVPTDRAASAKLVELYEQTNQQGQLEALYTQLMDQLRDDDTHETYAVYARKLAKLHEEAGSAPAALALLQEASERCPNDATLLRALVELQSAHSSPEDRVASLERLLAIESGKPAAALAKELAKLADAAGASDAAERALELGFTRAPGERELLTQLQKRLTERAAFEELGAVYMRLADSESGKRPEADWLDRAAQTLSAQAQRPELAAEALARLRALRPADRVIALRHVDCLLAAGNVMEAEAALTEVLESTETSLEASAELLIRRIQLRIARGDEAALDDVDAWVRVASAAPTNAMDPARILQWLLDLCERATEAREFPIVRGLRLRIVPRLVATGDRQAARQLLVEELDRDAMDPAILLQLARIEVEEQAYDDARATYERLLSVAPPAAAVDVSLELADLYERAGHIEDAMNTLERVRTALPNDIASRRRLAALAATQGMAESEAELCAELGALLQDENERFVALSRAGVLWLDLGRPAAEASALLAAARELKPTDLDVSAALVDAHLVGEQWEQAGIVIDDVLARYRGKRSRELGSIYHRQARVFGALGRRGEELAAMSTALDMDPQSGEAAAELATIAMEIGDWEVAARGLRAVTMQKVAGPMPKSQAFLSLGEIALSQGDSKRAALMLKRAIDEDAGLERARELLASIG